MKKIILFCLTLLAINAVQGQVSPSDGQISLYELDRAQGKYVLSVNFESREDGKSSFIVIGDTFAVQPHGAVSDVVISNAYVLQTKFGSSPTNEVVQTKMWTDKYRIPFPARTKLVFNNSVAELANWKNEALGETNIITYEGDDALRQLKKMGLEPPPDMDMDKAGGHQTQKP